MSNKKEYDEFLLRIKVSGANDKLEADWGRVVGLKAYNKVAKFANNYYIPIYNKVWDWIYKPKGGEWYPDTRPNYDKYYYGIFEKILRVYVQKYGRYNYATKRKICVHPDYDMYPTGEYENSIPIYETDNMISIKDFGV